MAKQRPSVLKRQREQHKRHRERQKAEKAALKRERRKQGESQSTEHDAEDDVLPTDTETGQNNLDG